MTTGQEQQIQEWWLAQKSSVVVTALVAVLIGVIGTTATTKNGKHLRALMEVLLCKVLGGSNTSSDHHDDSRSVVGWTAFLVALCRASESKVAPEQNRLLYDPVAEGMFGFWSGSAPFSARLAFAFRPIFSQTDIMQKVTPILSLRTFFLDEQIQQGLQRKKTSSSSAESTRNNNDHHEQQLVVLGAGLDSRVFRLASLLKETHTKPFELDFPGMLAEKRRLFGAVGYHYNQNDSNDAETNNKNVTAATTTTATQIGANLVTDEWDKKLIQNGFDPSLPTLWLLEGLLPYLKDSEVEVILQRINGLSAPSSRLLGTWISSSKTKAKLSIQQGFVEDPTKLLSGFGFTTEIQVQKLKDIAQRTNRFIGHKQMSEEYLITCHEKPALH